MQTWQRLLDTHGLTIAQVLATKSDFQTRHHYLNMRNCLEGILSAGIIPVVNENDVVSVTELMFTDNDELAGLLAGMVNADLLVMLSTVSGVFSGDQVIDRWDDSIHQADDIVGRGTSRLGRGGMHSKIDVARRTARLGTGVVIADGCDGKVLQRIINGEIVGTRFAPGTGSSPAKRWLASADGHAAGSVHVNQGAAEALIDPHRLTSLLLVGVENLEGRANSNAAT
jgi:glutamate 5-kinase